ncbi:hypothetical protein PsorP6_010633 [Peronosclerospora sorghi]|uniref:Uncharacterized protein n=1 Tax=Peronosclerospora sorghi TaxID=230839 RepID=A0ACC0VVJ5_9STRA|nr:hypothetical protein PsorP6_010633 [Peronosclerospora sorghi]
MHVPIPCCVRFTLRSSPMRRGPAVSDCWDPGLRSARLGVSHAYRGRAKTRSRVVRNRFGYPNFLSLWVDKLDQVKTYLQQENVPYTNDGIVKGPEEHDVMVIEPPADGISLAFFN